MANSKFKYSDHGNLSFLFQHRMVYLYWKSFMVDMGIFKKIWNSPLTNSKWQCVSRPNTMKLSTDQTLYTYQSVTFSPNSTFYRIMRGFHRTFAMVVACQQWTLTPSDNWFRPIWYLHIFYLLWPILSAKHNTSTERCSKLKSPETRQVQERSVSTSEHWKWDSTRCPKE